MNNYETVGERVNSLIEQGIMVIPPHQMNNDYEIEQNNKQLETLQKLKLAYIKNPEDKQTQKIKNIDKEIEDIESSVSGLECTKRDYASIYFSIVYKLYQDGIEVIEKLDEKWKAERLREHVYQYTDMKTEDLQKNYNLHLIRQNNHNNNFTYYLFIIKKDEEDLKK